VADRTCSVDGCEKRHHAHGYCSGHAYRWKIHGDPLAGKRQAAAGSPCAVDGCEKVMHAYGYCNSHAHRFRAFGDPLECRATRGPSPFERFDAKVQRTATCWLWIGATNQKGYGTFWSGDVRTGAHRWSYEYHVGPIPVGLEIDHLCRVRHCVNPAHLEAVTHAENLRRARVQLH